MSKEQTPVSSGELMIGNLLQYQSGTTLMQGRVTSIPNGKKICIDHIPVKIDNVLPVFLSPEILEKCGFKYRDPGAGGQDSWAGYGYWVLSDNNDFNLIGTKSGTVYFQRCWDWQIKYLHQLQNLYHALTGSHLKVDEI